MFKIQSLEVLKIREFRYFVYARLILTLAIQMQISTISLQLYYEYWRDEWALGLIGLTEAIPNIATSFFSGHLADIMSRRRILLVATFALLVGSVFLFLFSHQSIQFLSSLGMMALFSVVFIFGIIRSFLSASTAAFMSQLIPRHLYTQSATWNSTVWHTGAILGPVLAGLIYGYKNEAHADWCYGINCALFLWGFVLYLLIKPKAIAQKPQGETVFDSMKEGLRFVFRNKMIFSAISLDLFAVLFGGAVALIPAFTDKVLHLGPEAYGLLRTAPAIGAVLTSFLFIFWQPGKRAGTDLLWSVAAFGVFTIFFALCTNYWMAFAMLLLTGAFDNVSVIVRHSILQLMTPDNMRGRVSAINNIFIGSSNEIGAFESGAAAKLMGLVPSIIFGGGMTILVVLGIDRLNPKLRKLNIAELIEEKTT